MSTISRRVLLSALSLGLPSVSAAASFDFRLRSRTRSGEEKDSVLSLDPKRVAVVVVDVWTAHSCSGFNRHSAPFLEGMQHTLEGCRKLGMAIVHAPSGAQLDAIADHPARKNAIALPHVPLPASNGFLAGHSGNGPCTSPCMCPVVALKPGTNEPEVQCKRVQNNHNQHPAIRIENDDYFISAGRYVTGKRSALQSWGEPAQQELWNLVKHRRLTHIVYVGFASNMCIINREFAMIQATRMNLSPIVARDLTLAITFDGYNPITKSLDRSFGPAEGTRHAVEYIETAIGPSMDLTRFSRNA